MPPKTPSPSPLCGLYQCHTDRCTYRVAHTDTKHTDLLMQRRAPEEAEWRPAYLVDPAHLHRLLSFGSFTRLDHEPR